LDANNPDQTIMPSRSKPKRSRLKLKQHQRRKRLRRRAPAFHLHAHRQPLAVARSAREEDDQAFIDAVSDRW